MSPKISIITPTFNHEKFIRKCIESVLRQTMVDWEMIIIDDGSSDNTPKIVQQYRDSRIIYLWKEHRGINHLGENYNHALNISKGELIMILEGDDYIPPNRIELQLPSFEDNEVVLSHGKYAYMFDHGMMVYPSSFGIDVLNNRPIGSAFKAFLQGFNPIGTQSVMIRKSVLKQIGGFTQPNYLPLVDYPTWMRLALKGSFKFIPEVLGYWRRHPLSVTMNRNSQIFEGFLRYCDEFSGCFNQELRDFGLDEFIINRGAIGYLSLSWINLSNRDWKSALRLAQESWDRQQVLKWSFRAKIMIGLISAYLHIDIPSYFKKMNNWLNQKEVEKYGVRT